MLPLYHKLAPHDMSISKSHRSDKKQGLFHSRILSWEMALSRVGVPLRLPVQEIYTAARGRVPMMLLFFHKLARNDMSIFMPYRWGKKEVHSHSLA